MALWSTKETSHRWQGVLVRYITSPLTFRISEKKKKKKETKIGATENKKEERDATESPGGRELFQGSWRERERSVWSLERRGEAAPSPAASRRLSD